MGGGVGDPVAFLPDLKIGLRIPVTQKDWIRSESGSATVPGRDKGGCMRWKGYRGTGRGTGAGLGNGNAKG